MSTLILTLFITSSLSFLTYVFLVYPRKLDIPRVGPSSGSLGNTSMSYFQGHSLELIEEGYTKVRSLQSQPYQSCNLNFSIDSVKYKDGLYSLWTTDMDRVIVSAKFMKDFMSLPRSTVRLTASIRHAGPYTGMDIVEESGLQFDMCAGQLSQNIGRLAQPVFDEAASTLHAKFGKGENASRSLSTPVFPLMIELVTSAIARAFVGPGLCRNPEWLSTATGYTMDVAKVTTDLNAHYRVFHPVVAPFLKSYHEIQARFALARELLFPLIETRRSGERNQHLDMLQWLIDSAKGPDAQTDKIVGSMLFLNMAAIHTTAEVAANVLIELCAQPDYVSMLRKEMREALDEDPHISLATLNKLKKTDSFIKESHRLNPLGLMTFNRYLSAPVQLSNGITLPAKTYISMAHYPQQRDPEFYPAPLDFDGMRFFHLRQKEGKGDKYQFASISSTEPWWGVGKFACPGRFWASAQIKLLLMAILLEFDLGFPDGQLEKPERVVAGAGLKTSVTQHIVLKRLK
ncbi:cytochrome P450 [Massariosphaeria phaeospora]|uniref:Cytochrome P450 n=1 Tax=Massariosphaeria phaeospora TaxID=100035 RepID=A0A7C8I0N2_9PLEO|nr:cytochrome P450 [Massariosphaeria phaeospora]